MIFIFSILFKFTIASHFRNLDDSILFPINWAGFVEKPDLFNSPDYEKLTLFSSDQEEFHCLFPIKYGEIEDDGSSYRGPGPLSLLLPSLKKKSCTHKYETFWSYDVCHGDQILQYHKEVESISSRKNKRQQYILGRLTEENIKKLVETAALEDENMGPAADIGEVQVEGSNMPYYSVHYTDGTVCKLTERPRTTRVLHVCYEHGHNDVYSVKETSTCEYDIVVLSHMLCSHPRYRKQEVPDSPVHCMAAVPGPRRPRELLRVEAQSLKLKTMPHTELNSDLDNGGIALGKIDSHVNDIKIIVSNTDDDDEEDSSDGFESYTDESGEQRNKVFPPKPLTADQTAVKQFLSGEQCLDGGVGWWQYEFCYGRHVNQYHTNPDGSKLSILLGTFDKERHVQWIKKHPARAPSNYIVNHFYSNGAVCDVTGGPRSVEVRLLCYPPSKGVGVSAVALYLLEPEPCQYVLGVETGLVCDLLAGADEYGLLKESSKIKKKNIGKRNDIKEDEHHDEGKHDDYDNEDLVGNSDLGENVGLKSNPSSTLDHDESSSSTDSGFSSSSSSSFSSSSTDSSSSMSDGSTSSNAGITSPGEGTAERDDELLLKTDDDL